MPTVKKIRERVLKGVPYIGSSAGTNVAAINICTTNDMPIIQPKRLEAIGLLPFNVNVHFECGGTCSEIQRRETRIDRLRDYLELYDSSPAIVCIRDSSALYIEGHVMAYVGTAPGKLFTRGHEEPTTIPVGTDLSFLLEGRTSNATKMCLT
jgi:dipeptidase E